MKLNISIGDAVIVTDGSYMLTICPKEHKLTRYPKLENFNGNLALLNHCYIVVATNVSCPSYHANYLSDEILRPANNCIIKDLNNGLIWFCSEINIKLV